MRIKADLLRKPGEGGLLSFWDREATVTPKAKEGEP